MKTRNIKILILVVLVCGFFAVFCTRTNAFPISDGGLGGIGTESVTNPLIGSPRGSLTEPVSSYDRTAFSAPRPDITSGNMIVTGNIGGGKHFRGYLPYGSESDIRANLESTSIDSFLRYSTGSYQPFYSPTGSTIFVTGPVSVGTIISRSEKIREYSGMGEYFTPFSQPILTQPVTSPLISESGTISAMRHGYEQNLLSQVQGYRTSEQFLLLEDELKNIEVLGQPLSTGEQIGISLLQSQAESTSISDELKPFETKVLEEQLEGVGQLDIYEQMKQLIGSEDEQQVDSVEANKRILEAVEEEWKSKAETATVGMAKLLEQRKNRRTSFSSGGGGTSSAATEETTDLPKYKTFAGESGDRFNYYMKEAEEYLKGGKYYQAADAYTLASVYKPLDPLPYIGKSHALFSAGEYLSSSRMLALGMKMFPDYAYIKVNIVEMIGDKNLIEMRLSDLVKWASASGSGELHFLFAYICYQMDKQVLAKAAIDEAYKKMPEDITILVLRKVIDESRGGD